MRCSCDLADRPGQVTFSVGQVSSHTGNSCWALEVGFTSCQSATVLVRIPCRQATLAGLAGADGWIGVMSTISTSCS